MAALARVHPLRVARLATPLVALMLWAGGAVAEGAPAPGGVEAGKDRAAAARQRGASRGLPGRVRDLARALDLDPEQQRQVTAILVRQRTRVLAARGDASLTPARRIAAMEAIGVETTEAIRAVLTDAQRAKLGPPRQRSRDGERPPVEEWMKRTTAQR